MSTTVADAATLTTARGPAPATLRDDLGPSVLFLLSGWRELGSSARRELRRAMSATAGAGRLPVVWSDAPLRPADRAEVEQAGALAYEAAPGGPVGVPATCTTRPGPAQLVSSLQPDAVVFASEQQLRATYPFVAPIVGPSPVLGFAPDRALPTDLARRVDVVVRGGGLAAALVAALDGPPASAPIARDLGVIDPVEVVPGVVSVVIPVWNRWDLTSACLESLRAGGGGPLELVVVDNGSDEETVAGLAAQPDVVVVRNEVNLGFPKAVNQGLRASSGELVCVLNNDTEVVPGWLDELRTALAQPGVGMVGPRCNAISGSQCVPGAPAMSSGDEVRAWGRGWAAAHAGVAWPTSRLVGFCLLARRDLFSRLGGFDERFGIGNFEDDELCQRVLADGGRLVVADGSVVLHHGSATFHALGLDYAKVLADASRRRVPEPMRGGPVDGLVLAGTDHGATLRSAGSLLAVVDRVRVLAPFEAGLADLAVAGLRTFGHDVEVVAVDWTSDAAAGAMFAGLTGEAALVVGSGEEVIAPDPARARAELGLYAGHGAVAAVLTAGGPEVRLAPARPESVAVVGGTSDVVLTTLGLASR